MQPSPPIVELMTAPPARLAEGTIQAGYLRGIEALVAERGGSLRRALERFGLTPDALAEPGRAIDCAAAVNLLEHVSADLGDRLFGIHLARRQDADIFGHASLLARSAPSFGAGLRGLADYVPVVNSPEGFMEVTEGREAVELRWGTWSPLGSSEQANIHGLLLMMRILRELGGPGFTARAAHLRFDISRAAREALEEELGCRVHVGAACNALGFAAERLARPLPGADAPLHNLARAWLDFVRARSERGMAERVRAYVRAALPNGACSIERCARRLRLAPRTLQKELAGLGTSFSELVEAERFAAARTALAGEASLDDIAFELGYAEQTSFGRAFKRWTGTSPDQWRRRAERAPSPPPTSSRT